jgi:hypothetical protein
MKHFSLIVIALALLFAPRAFGQSYLDLSKFDLVTKASDEFEGYANYADFYSNSKWQFHPVDDNDLHNTFIADPNCNAVYDGNQNNVDILTITENGVQKKVLGFKAKKRTSSYNHTYPTGYRELQYNSGMITLNPNFQSDNQCCSWTRGLVYGIFEMRCKLPRGNNVASAFWLWSGSTEIDVFEANGDGRLHTNNVHNWSVSEPHPTCQAQVVKQEGLDLSQEFHTYAVAWTPQKVTFFFDGRVTRTVSNIVTHPVPANIIINLSVNNGANPRDSTYPWELEPGGNPLNVYDRMATMQIDYVRVYQPKPAYSDPTQPNWAYNNYLAHGWQKETLDLPYQSYKAMSFVPNCISASSTNGDVFYSGPDGKLRRYNAAGNYEEIVAQEFSTYPFFQNQAAIQGDVVVGENNQVFYKGNDNRIQTYYQATGGVWHHGWIDDGSVADTYISSQPGALTVVPGNILFYRNRSDDRVHQYKWTGVTSTAPNGWQHQVMAPSPGSAPYLEYASGDLTQYNGEVFYLGPGGRIQRYWNNNGSYEHGWVDPAASFSGSPSACSSQFGALAPCATGLYYRGADNFIHKFSRTNGVWSRQIISSTFPVNGRLLVNDTGQLFYRGTDNKMQNFYFDSGQWMHGWLSTWGWVSPQTSLGSDNFTTTAGQPIYFQNPDGYMAKFYWGLWENLNPNCVSTPNGDIDATNLVVYRGTSKGKTGISSTISDEKASQLNQDAFAGYKLYPNPATDVVTITTPANVPGGTIIVYSMYGERVLQVAVDQDGSTELNLKGVKKGLYSARIAIDGVITNLKLSLE